MKICTKCNCEKEESGFSPRRERGVSKGHSWCRECKAEKERRRRFVLGEAYLRLERQRYKIRRKNPVELKRAAVYSVNRYRNNAQVRLRNCLGARLRKAVKSGRAAKRESIIDLLGCSLDQFVGYLELQFLPGMTWENHGQWHMDPKRPCASFDLTLLENRKRCYHYSNFQPLWAADNIRKGDKIE